MKIKVTSQLICFLIFLLFFFWLGRPEFFLRINPLGLISIFLSSHLWLKGLFFTFILIFSTFLFGRFFCGYICPLGSLIDFFGRIFWGGVKKKEKPVSDLQFKKVKYLLFLFSLGLALTGILYLHYFDPLSFCVRFFSTVVNPVLIFLGNLGLNLIRPLARHFGWYSLVYKHFPQPVFSLSFLTFSLFVFVVGLNYFVPRFWCRYLCPLGAFLGVISYFRRLNPQVSEKCNHCGICEKQCLMGAMRAKGGVDQKECILCGECKKKCPRGTVSFQIRKSSSKHEGVNLSKRAFISSFSLGILGGITVRNNYLNPAEPNLLRPPNSLGEEDFLKRCLRCGACLKVCPTNTLQPCLGEAGIAGFFTPRLVMRRGECEANCARCGEVCPVGAIKRFSPSMKRKLKIGTAVVQPKFCLAWKEMRLCLVCDEQCPYNAIKVERKGKYPKPKVIEEKCVGCGLCEYKCPASGRPGIRIFPIF